MKKDNSALLWLLLIPFATLALFAVFPDGLASLLTIGLVICVIDLQSEGKLPKF